MIANMPVTHAGYTGCVTTSERLKCRSEPYRGSWNASYATSLETHPHAGVRARARARAHTKTHMCFLRNYVTQKEEKKKEQVGASEPGYAAGYVAVTHDVTTSHSLRAEVTHA